MRTRVRRFLWSAYAPRIIAGKITELLFLAGGVLVVWLCFGGPVFTLYCDLIAAAARAAGTVA